MVLELSLVIYLSLDDWVVPGTIRRGIHGPGNGSFRWLDPPLLTPQLTPSLPPPVPSLSLTTAFIAASAYCHCFSLLHSLLPLPLLLSAAATAAADVEGCSDLDNDGVLSFDEYLLFLATPQETPSLPYHHCPTTHYLCMAHNTHSAALLS